MSKIINTSGVEIVNIEDSGNIEAVGFKKSGSSDNYILLGGGGHKQLSELGGGTVTSVGLTVPTGLSVSGSPITTSGTLAINLASGYSIPTTTKQTEWTAKQDSLVSGTNIKTLNGNSVLGSGDLSITLTEATEAEIDAL